ncbi:unnamed protein product [Lactuca virosa]|uniref:Uncharacterized protein n=1 Tax=Lactuca virosa TaxID=75947 RepID=A0AAU9MQ24_9ASTR|nr:unnamed protein product [Lactuca virosa]
MALNEAIEKAYVDNLVDYAEVNRKEPVNNGMLLLLPKEELEDETSPITPSTKCRGSRMWKHLQLQPSYCAPIHSRFLEILGNRDACRWISV